MPFLHTGLLSAALLLVLFNCGAADAIALCDIYIQVPPVTFFALRMSPTNDQFKAWMFSPTMPTMLTPPHSTPCGSPSYLGMYAPSGASEICMNTTSLLEQTSSGCQWRTTGNDGATVVEFIFNINCGATPPDTPMVPPNVVTVQDTSFGASYTANFTSQIFCPTATPPLFRIAKKRR